MPQYYKEHSVTRDHRGFTLVELIVVIAILAVLTAILAPQFTRYVEKSRIAADASTADEIYRAVQLAVAEDAENEIQTGAKVTWDSSGISVADDASDKLVAELTASLGAGYATTKMKANSHSTSSLEFTVGSDGTVPKPDNWDAFIAGSS